MKIVREKMFETNSSSTHTLVYLKKGHKLPERSHRKSLNGEEMPIIWDYKNFKVKVRNFADPDSVKESGLSVPEYNASYLFTWLQMKKYSLNWYGENTAEEIEEALAQFHLMLLENDLIPEYEPFTIKYHVYDYNFNLEYPNDPKAEPSWEIEDAYMEMNDGGFIEGLKDIWKIIDTKEHLKKFLTKGKINIKYRG